MADMNGQVALVTGGIRGIGLAIGERLMNRGVRVAAGYSSHRDDAQLFADKYADHGVTIHQGNIGSNEDCVRVIGEVLEQHGQLDILVNNAGIVIDGPLEEMTVEHADRLWAVDVRAVFAASQAAARHMSAGGRIITIGSALAERVPVPGLTLYAMVKSALTGLTKGLARDLGPRGITATVVHGGLIDTDMNPANGPAAAFLSTVPALGHYGTAGDIAATVAHLAGDGGRYVTGTAITVDGGFAA